MIIGNNQNNNRLTSNFKERHNLVMEEGKKNQNQVNMYHEDKAYKITSSDPTNKIAMSDKAFSMLQERYRNGLITVEEFNKKCEQLNKFRENNK